MKREEIRWFPSKPKCDAGSRGFVTVGLQEIKPAVFLLLSGYGLSIIVFIVERILRKLFTFVDQRKTTFINKPLKIY